MSAHQLHPSSTRLPSWPTVLVVLGITLAAVALLWLSVQAQTQNTDRRQATAAATLASDQRDALAGSVAALREQVQSLGEQPVAPPADTTVQDVRPSSGASIAVGVPGPAGPTGATGASGASATASPAVTGAAGAPGPTGAGGQDGADGAPGQAVPGAAGAPGSDGRGVTSLSCEGSGASSSWVVTYSDGTTATAAGPCRVQEPVPSAPPSDTPTDEPPS